MIPILLGPRGTPAVPPVVPATALNWGGSSAEFQWGSSNYLTWG